MHRHSHIYYPCQPLPQHQKVLSSEDAVSLDLSSNLRLLMKDLVKVMCSLYWQRIMEIPFQSLAVAHELSIDAGKGSQGIQISLYNFFFFFPMSFCFKWTGLLHSDKGKLFKSHLICVVSIQKECNLIYCSSNGWNTTLLNVIKNPISAPSPNKSIGNMVVTYA